MTAEIIHGDCLEVMATLPAESVHCVVTSPPYYGLRDYGVPGQIGLEATPDEYVDQMVDVFRHVRRILRDDGAVWLNLGDSYAGKPGGRPGSTAKVGNTISGCQTRLPEDRGLDSLKPKDLIGIPWRVAFALQADGWWLRQDIIWHKPNPMPESVRDRCTKAHEYIFLLSKKPKYYFDSEAIKEAAVTVGDTRHLRKDKAADARLSPSGREKNGKPQAETRNRRSVWTIATKPFKGAHFAVMPQALVDPCIKAGCPSQACPTCGKGWERVRERNDVNSSDNEVIKHDGVPGLKKGTSGDRVRSLSGATYKHVFGKTLGHRPACACPPADPVPGIVMDPFAGAFTVAAVASELGRRSIGIELNPEYCEMGRARLAHALGLENPEPSNNT